MQGMKQVNNHQNKWKYGVSTQIGDFGLSRDLLDENYYISKGGMIPIKWTAPEVIICLLLVSMIVI